MRLYVLAENLETRQAEVHTRGCNYANSTRLYDVADDKLSETAIEAAQEWGTLWGGRSIPVGPCCEGK